jgi:hypothetical protein
MSGEVGKPCKGHVHDNKDDFEEDTRGDHEILISNDFLLWEKPTFAARQTIRLGDRNVNSNNLEDLLFLV